MESLFLEYIYKRSVHILYSPCHELLFLLCSCCQEMSPLIIDDTHLICWVIVFCRWWIRLLPDVISHWQSNSHPPTHWFLWFKDERRRWFSRAKDSIYKSLWIKSRLFCIWNEGSHYKYLFVLFYSCDNLTTVRTTTTRKPPPTTGVLSPQKKY